MTDLGPMLVRVTTADGARIALKRKPVRDGTPVIFLHGLAVNADLWDLPEIRGAGFHYRSLAAILHEAGYDIWLMNLRGHGGPHMLSEPPPGQDDWCVDHFIVFDLPAVVDHVLAQTGRRPFVIGNSMGAMTLAGYVQGATLAGAGDAQRVAAAPELARQRSARLAGAVFVEFPAALRWPSSLFDEGGQINWTNLLRDWHRTDADTNYPFELLARWGWLQALVEAAGVVPLDWLRADPSQPWWSRLPEPVAGRVAALERAAVQAMLQLGGTFTGATNHRAEVILQGRRYVMDHMKAGVLKQMAESVRRGAFVSGLGTPPHVYSDHYQNITVPALVVLGERDRIANAEVTRTVFFERIQSADKTCRVYEGIAHGEFEAAPVACERVYPDIKSWLAARDRALAAP
jgi:pimeloyl-ACP methyl ester carboxylesterase